MLGEAFHITEDAAGGNDEIFSRGCQARAGLGTVEQQHAKLVLDLLDAPADDGLADVQLLRAGAEADVAGAGDDDLGPPGSLSMLPALPIMWFSAFVFI